MECRVLYEVGKHSGVVLNISNECLRKDYFDKNHVAYDRTKYIEEHFY